MKIYFVISSSDLGEEIKVSKVFDNWGLKNPEN